MCEIGMEHGRQRTRAENVRIDIRGRAAFTGMDHSTGPHIEIDEALCQGSACDKDRREYADTPAGPANGRNGAVTGVAPLAQSQSTCFVCGPAHPSGLRIQFSPAADGTIEGHWVATRTWEGFAGIIHGGIVSTVLDEAMSKAVAAAAIKALTAELRVRFHLPVRPGQPLTIRGWIVERHRRRIRTEAALTGDDGQEFAHGWATFLPVPSGSQMPDPEDESR